MVYEAVSTTSAKGERLKAFSQKPSKLSFEGLGLGVFPGVSRSKSLVFVDLVNLNFTKF